MDLNGVAKVYTLALLSKPFSWVDEDGIRFVSDTKDLDE